MATTTLAAVLLGAEEEVTPFPPAAYALGALALFAVLLAITWAFRNWASKH